MARRRVSEKLRRAMSRGGPGGAARRSRRGFSFGSIVSWIAERFGFGDSSEAEEVASLGEDIANAGIRMEQLPAIEAILIDEVPLNAFIMGVEWEGARMATEIIIPWHDPLSGRSGELFHRILSDDPLTGDEISQQAAQFISDMVKWGSGPFANVQNLGDVEPGDWFFAAPQRRF